MSPRSTPNLAYRLGSLLVLGSLLFAWEGCARFELCSPLFFPAPTRVGSYLIEAVRAGEVVGDVALTLRHLLLGFAVASASGFALGAGIGSVPLLCELLEPTLEFLRPLPASAFLPAAILLLGFRERTILAVIGFGASWPVLLGTVHGLRSVDPRLRDLGRMLRLSRWRMFRIVQLPAAMPDVRAGMRVSLAIALILAVIGEMLVGQGGIGHMLLLAARSYRSIPLYGGLFVLGAIGWSSDELLTAAFRTRSFPRSYGVR